MNELVLMDANAMDRTLTRLVHEIVERNRGTENVALLGIRTRGVYLARRVAKKLCELEGREVPLGELDITLYRDDLFDGCDAVYRGSRVEFPVDGKDVVLCDDVLYTGRTARSAIAAVLALGRPKSIHPFSPTIRARTCRLRARSASWCIARSATGRTACGSSAKFLQRLSKREPFFFTISAKNLIMQVC